MAEKTLSYEIRVDAHLSDDWSDWFDGLLIRNEASGETTLSGSFPDQAALYGVLNKIHALNLTLISVHKATRGYSERGST